MIYTLIVTDEIILCLGFALKQYVRWEVVGFR